MTNLNVIDFLRQLAGSPQVGRIHLAGKNNITWCLDVVNGQLKFASHSLQYLTAIEDVLTSVDCETALPLYWRLVQIAPYQYPKSSRGLEGLSWSSQIIEALVQYEALSPQQAETALAKLTEDAVDALLGIDTASVNWATIPQTSWHLGNEGQHIASLLDTLTQKVQQWQPLSDVIYSPHQRPYCETRGSLTRPVQGGQLSSEMLEALARMMQGASLRQLARAVKQDEIQLAALLYPYIQQRVIKLWPPVSPLNRLPWLPGATLPALTPASIDVSPATKTMAVSVTAPHTTERPPVSSQWDSGYRGAHNETDPAARLAAHEQSSTPTHDLAIQQSRMSSSSSNSLPKPLSSGPKSSSNGLDKPLSSAPESRYLIICIDDSRAMLEKIDSYLDPARFELKAVLDPVASISRFCTEKPDLVLMDVSMPSINGNSLCEILKRSYVFKNVPIIMISSNASPLNMAMAESAGATAYLEKPFSKAQLLETLETYLSPEISFLSSPFLSLPAKF